MSELQNAIVQLLAMYGENAVLSAIATQLESDPETAHLADQLDEIRLMQPELIQQALVVA
jgi:predicted transcriptional regulator with HTH domain